jgi:hypothetical protein
LLILGDKRKGLQRQLLPCLIFWVNRDWECQNPNYSLWRKKLNTWGILLVKENGD